VVAAAAAAVAVEMVVVLAAALAVITTVTNEWISKDTAPNRNKQYQLLHMS
jgi:hypothetical protein